MKVLVNVKLSEHKYKTPEGYLVCQDAILARTGKQTYLESELYPGSDSDELVEVDRPAKEVFDEKTLASFENKPITCEHPDVNVGPDNYNELAVGHVNNIRRGKVDGQDVMLGDLLITDAQCIEDIENGVRTDLSCGYDCDITDGPNPCQINIRGNHVALCEQGRAGIARIIDSTWIKPIVKDSVSKGSLIQEFGKQGKQYKIAKIVGNVIYANNLVDGKVVLFKKDEENIEWATITKSEVKDSYSTKFAIWLQVKDEEEINKITDYIWKKHDEKVFHYKLDLKDILNIYWFDSKEEANLFLKELNEKFNIVKSNIVKKELLDAMDPNSHTQETLYKANKFIKEKGLNAKAMGSVSNGKVRVVVYEDYDKVLNEFKKEFNTYDEDAELEEFKIKFKDSIKTNDSAFDLILETDRPWDLTLNQVSSYVSDKYGYSLAEIEEKSAKGIPMYQPVALSYSNVGGSDIEKLSIGSFSSEKEAYDFYEKELKPRIKHWADSPEEEIKVSVFKGNIKDASEKLIRPNDYSSEFTQKELDDFISSLDDNTDSFPGKDPNRKKKVFVNKEEKEKFMKSLPEEAEVRADEFDHSFEKDGEEDRYLVYWEVYYNDPVKVQDAGSLKKEIVEAIHDVLGDEINIDYGARGIGNIIIRFKEEKRSPYMQNAALQGVIIALEKLGIPVDKKDSTVNRYHMEIWTDVKSSNELMDVKIEDKPTNREILSNLGFEYTKDGFLGIPQGEMDLEVWNYKGTGHFPEVVERLRNQTGSLVAFKNPSKNMIMVRKKYINDSGKKGSMEYSPEFYKKAIKAAEKSLDKLSEEDEVKEHKDLYESHKSKLTQALKSTLKKFRNKSKGEEE